MSRKSRQLLRCELDVPGELAELAAIASCLDFGESLDTTERQFSSASCLVILPGAQGARRECLRVAASVVGASVTTLTAEVGELLSVLAARTRCNSETQVVDLVIAAPAMSSLTLVSALSAQVKSGRAGVRVFVVASDAGRFSDMAQLDGVIQASEPHVAEVAADVCLAFSAMSAPHMLADVDWADLTGLFSGPRSILRFTRVEWLPSSNELLFETEAARSEVACSREMLFTLYLRKVQGGMHLPEAFHALARVVSRDAMHHDSVPFDFLAENGRLGSVSGSVLFAASNALARHSMRDL